METAGSPPPGPHAGGCGGDGDARHPEAEGGLTPPPCWLIPALPLPLGGLT
jgi:hypothetical protein